jgi:26S proteasome regulatory subunit N7
MFTLTLLDSRLKVYEGLYSMAVRNFSKAADLFLETVSTFTSYELMDYKQVRD